MIKKLLIIILILLVGCSQQIGGERDEHGCLGPAGYTWSEDIQACWRSWELDDNQQRASKIAVQHVGPEYGLTIEKVNVARCPGCFVVHMTNPEHDQINVNLNNWIVVN